MRSMLEWALEYCNLGWKIMPIFQIEQGQCSCGNEACNSPGKHPILKHGVLDASNYSTIVKSWAKKYPKANLAVATGHESGFVVVDVDFKSNGAASYSTLAAKYKFPSTVMAKTGAGFHLYFQYAEGIKNKVGIDAGIDIRSNGGYVLIPPSNHLSGNTYMWLRRPTIDNIAEMPEWLYEFIIARGETVSDGEDYAETIPEGRRNNFAHHMGCVMRNKGFSKAAIKAALMAENAVRCIPPLTEDEIDLVVSSVGRYEKGESGLGTWF